MDLKTAASLHRAGRLAEAESAYRAFLSAEPANERAMHLLGIALGQMGRPQESLEWLQKAAKLSAPSAELLGNLAAAQGQLGKHAEAADTLWSAIRLRPDYPDGHSNLGVALEHLRDWAGAASAYREALRLRRDFPEAHFNLGNVLRKVGHFDEAIEHYRKALSLRPTFARAAEGLGGTLVDRGDAEEGCAWYRRAVELDPDNASLRSAMLYTIHYDPDMGPKALADAHFEYGRRFGKPAPLPPRAGDDIASRRIRIGYVSSDFREHTVPRFIGAALKHHDRSAFEVFCYSDVAPAEVDAITATLKSSVEHWRDTAGLSDSQLAELIRSDGIDILVDLRGHGGSNRLRVFAARTAPVQVNMVGYFDTTGLPTMDWRITDDRQDPSGSSERFHTEKLARLPGGCWCYSPDEEIGGPPSPPVRDPPALRNGFVTLGSLNKIVKISQPCAQLWKRVLSAIPNSRLLLATPQGAMRALADRLKTAGIPTERLILAPKIKARADYLGRFGEIDICLDPFPFNGITTTCDSLWMGAPVVTLGGKTTVSRAGRSILHSAGLAELAVNDPDGYVECAANLAGNIQRLTDLRRGMRARLRESGLLGGPKFTAELESAFRRMLLVARK